MRIAVLFNQTIRLGGGFNQSLPIASLLKDNQSADYDFFFITTEREVHEEFKNQCIPIHYIRISKIDKFIAALVKNDFVFNVLKKCNITVNHKFVSYLNRNRIDLVYFTSPSHLAHITKNHNYILTVFDLCHRDNLEFPEVRENNKFENRENFYKRCAPKAVRVLTDSEIGRQNLIRRYRLDANRIVTFPFLPSRSVLISDEEYDHDYVDIRKKYNIPGEYIYYPAQFWPHKNHIYIIDGLKILLEKYNVRLNAVFSGSDKGNLNRIRKYADKVGIGDQIFYPGFVPSQEIPYLYRQSKALVMPTYFGPTNIPPLEAFALKVPVLYSDLPGLRDQVENAALLLDLSDPESMAVQIMKLKGSRALREEITANGYELFSSLMESGHWIKLKSIFDDYKTLMNCWKG